ncbi:MAG TPA: winged helix DNA-binding domain-containing protein [Acidimicrobiales bacterium]|nr:winged helix DNA-binding domain-containing protein [Acidimicrobiales bacterium]
MKLTGGDLNRATLGRQMLLEREPLAVDDAVRRIVAIQAQAPASPYVALWNRIAGFRPAQLDAAFAEQTVVKSSLLRITLHVVHADDFATLHAAMRPTLHGARLDYRFTESTVTPEAARAAVVDFVAYATEPRTTAELTGWIEKRFGVPSTDFLWRGVRTISPILHVPSGPPWAFGLRPSYVAAPDAAATMAMDSEEAMVGLVLRFLDGFGPASLADVAKFATVAMPRVRRAVAELGDRLERYEGPNGEVLIDVPGGLLPGDGAPAPPRLMAMWDSILLAYHDRTRVIPPDYRTTVVRSNGDFLPTVLIDGRVAGLWRPVAGGIEVSCFRSPTKRQWAALAAEAAALVGFLSDREPQVFRRHHHWWDKISLDHVRVLAG